MTTTPDPPTFTITPDAPFSLAAAATFGFGPNTGRPKPDGNAMRLAFVTDDLAHQVGVLLTQDPAGTVHGEVNGELPGDIDPVRDQVARILSLDRSGRDWLDVGVRDPVIGALQAGAPGLRPVLFHSPYEAAAWSVLALRRHRVQAAALRTRLSAAHGATFAVGGEDLAAFPRPEQLLRVETFPGLDPTRIARLHAAARAALDGRLDAGRLRALGEAEALRDIATLPGLGPTYATLVLLRATGVTDAMTYDEPRIGQYAAHFYGLDHSPATRAEIESLSERWRPFRTWTCVLLRTAGDRAGVPYEVEPAVSARRPRAAAPVGPGSSPGPGPARARD